MLFMPAKWLMAYEFITGLSEYHQMGCGSFG